MRAAGARGSHRALVTAVLVLGIACAVFGAPRRAVAIDGAPALTEAASALVMDSAGNVLFEKNADERYAPASITKIMTAVCALDSDVPLDREITISKVEFPDEPAAQMANLPVGGTITFGDLLEVMLVYSANDCAVMVGEAVSGSESAFVDVMNAKARELGLTQTFYRNTHGLEDDGHLTSARDLVNLGRYALENYPFIAEAVAMPEVTVTVGGQDFTYETTDELLGSYPGAMGIKTGQVARGCTFLGAVRQDNTALYSAVLGCATPEGRFADTRALWDWAYGAFWRPEVAGPTMHVGRYDYPLLFGWDIAASSPRSVVALRWPDQGPMTVRTKLAPASSTFLGGESAGAALWSQQGRTIIAAGYVAEGLEPSLGISHDPLYEVLAFHGIENLGNLS